MSVQIPRLGRATRKERESHSAFREIFSAFALEAVVWIILGLIALVAMSA